MACRLLSVVVVAAAKALVLPVDQEAVVRKKNLLQREVRLVLLVRQRRKDQDWAMLVVKVAVQVRLPATRSWVAQAVVALVLKEKRQLLLQKSVKAVTARKAPLQAKVSIMLAAAAARRLTRRLAFQVRQAVKVVAALAVMAQRAEPTALTVSAEAEVVVARLVLLVREAMAWSSCAFRLLSMGLFKNHKEDRVRTRVRQLQSALRFRTSIL